MADERRPPKRPGAPSASGGSPVGKEKDGPPSVVANNPARRRRPRRADGAVSEFEAIATLSRGLLDAQQSPHVVVGIGDDAAVLARPRGELVCSVDASLEGVHFDRKWLSLEMAAARAHHAAVSDLAAMGANPIAAVVALEAPPGSVRSDFAAIARGQARACRETGCVLVGGNIASGHRFGFTTTVLGSCATGAAVRRSGAKAGDEVWLSAPVGWAALGLSLLQTGQVTFERRGFCSTLVGESRTAALRAASCWASPRAAVDLGLAWATAASAMIDVSDSLASEVQHLASASRVRVVLEAELLEQAHVELLSAAAALGRDPWPLVLYGGEEYALLATGAALRRPAGAFVVGRVERGAGAYFHSARGRERLASGFDHLRR